MNTSMELLNRLALKSDQNAKYSAIIYYNNDIIGVGYNHLIHNSSTNQFENPSCLLCG